MILFLGMKASVHFLCYYTKAVASSLGSVLVCVLQAEEVAAFNGIIYSTIFNYFSPGRVCPRVHIFCMDP